MGAVRASLGIASNEADVERLIKVLATFRDLTFADSTSAQAVARLVRSRPRAQRLKFACGING